MPLSIVLIASAPACSSNAAHPSLVASSVGGSEQQVGGNSGAGEIGGTDSAGAGGDAGEGSNAESGTGNSGSSGDGAAGAPNKPGPSICAQTATWSTAVSVDGVSTNVAASLLSVTADELDLAFLRAGALYVAHRSKTSATFDVGSPITIPAGWSAKQGAALSGDGKRLVLVSDPDQKKLGELTRPTREQPFAAEVDERAFSNVNQNAIYTGKIYASPVVSGRDEQLFFNSSFPEAASTVVISTRSNGAPWTAPVTLTPVLLDGSGPTQRRLPTGISADERTLFYFNEESSQEEARFRASSALSSALYDMLSLGHRRGATPNSACDRLYSESDSDVVVEKD